MATDNERRLIETQAGQTDREIDALADDPYGLRSDEIAVVEAIAAMPTT